jgi:hypothetical protein
MQYTSLLRIRVAEGIMKSRLSLKPLAGIAIALTATPVSAQQRTFELPTATEVFNLRSKCAALGEKILEEDQSTSRSEMRSQRSHYDPQTNRCYVELITLSVNHDVADPYHRILFDGQTKDLLAFAQIEKGRRSGLVFGRSPSDVGWDDANEYIDEMMKDDRR